MGAFYTSWYMIKNVLRIINLRKCFGLVSGYPVVHRNIFEEKGETLDDIAIT